MLFWTAVINGVVAVPIMVAMMLVVDERQGRAQARAAALDQILGWLATAADGGRGRAADLVELRREVRSERPQVSTMPSVEPDAPRIAAAVRQRQILLRAHLDQARGGALELVRLIALGGEIERVRARPAADATSFTALS